MNRTSDPSGETSVRRRPSGNGRKEGISGLGSELHSLTVWSLPPLITNLPSAEKAAAHTSSECPFRVANSCHEAVANNLTVWSALGTARVLPSGESAIEPIQLPKLVSVAMVRLWSRFHTFTQCSGSWLPEIKVLPSAEKRIDRMAQILTSGKGGQGSGCR